MAAPLIRSGSFDDQGFVAGYTAERLGEVLVERVIWREDTPVLSVGSTIVRQGSDIWYRFWLPAHDQVVERYFRADGTPSGTLVDVCAPLKCDSQGCSAVDYLLDIWVDPAGQVTIYNEAAHEAAVTQGLLTAGEAELADRHLRELTGAIARGRFPPALVRNWQVDPARIKRGDE